MSETAYRLTVFTLYQFSLLLGITLFPVALLARRAGIRLPADAPARRLREVYEEARA
ncbi:MAG: hypothetical protein ABEJ06_05235 [Haloarculaceae archaeon]